MSETKQKQRWTPEEEWTYRPEVLHQTLGHIGGRCPAIVSSDLPMASFHRMSGTLAGKCHVAEANAERAVACVRACKGIPDPAAAIEAARKALEKMFNAIGVAIACQGMTASVRDLCVSARTAGDEALNLLGEVK